MGQITPQLSFYKQYTKPFKPEAFTFRFPGLLFLKGRREEREIFVDLQNL